MRFSVCARTRRKEKGEVAGKGNQRAGARKTRTREKPTARSSEGRREGDLRRERERERERDGGSGERAKSRDEVLVVKSTVAAPAKNSN